MAITLELSSANPDDEVLQDLTRQLCSDLRDEKIPASLATNSTPAGHKGDLPVWGQIAIATLSSTVLTSFVSVLTAYVQRAKSVTFKLKKDGREIEVSATNVGDEKLQQILARFFEEEE